MESHQVSEKDHRLQTGLDSPDADDGEGDEEVPLSKWLWSSPS